MQKSQNLEKKAGLLPKILRILREEKRIKVALQCAAAPL